MSRIFIPTTDGWDVEPLQGNGYFIRHAECNETPALWDEREREDASADARLLRVGERADVTGSSWVLVADASTRMFVNGEPLALGIALLRDRDELRVAGGAAVYFSTERQACVEPCARDDAPRCPRCAQAILRGELSVRCPGCGVAHHQLTERECWTYSPSCALCRQASDLGAGLRWTPEVL